MTATREENLAVIAALGGHNETHDDIVHDAVSDSLGLDAMTDEAIALMASEYQRLAQAGHPSTASSPVRRLDA